MPEKTQLYTSPVVIATAGATIDGRNISEKTLQKIAENYDPNLYEALINYEHLYGNYGSVVSVEYGDHPHLENKKALTAVLAPNRFLLTENKIYEEGVHFSIEYFSHFQDEKTPYLAGLAITNHPASVGTSRLEFSQKDIQTGAWTDPQKIKYPNQNESKNLATKFKTLFQKKEETPSKEQKEFQQQEEKPSKEQEKFCKEQKEFQQQQEKFYKEQKEFQQQQEKFCKEQKEFQEQQEKFYKEQKEFQQQQHNKINEMTQEQESYAYDPRVIIAIKKSVSTEQFAATPEAQQRLFKEVQAQEDFLNRINMITVGSQKGQSIYGSLSGSVMRRETSRSPVDVSQDHAYSYETIKRYFDFLVTHDKRDAWIGTGQDFNEIYKRLYREQYAIDLINNAFNGTGRDATTVDILKVDKGWGQLLADYESGKQVLSEHRAGSGVIILGSPRSRSLAGLTSVNSSGKNTIAMTAHGFIAGGKITITNDSNFEGTFVVDSSTTANNLVYVPTSSHPSSNNFASTAVVTQQPDYQTIDHLVSTMEQGIKHERRNGLEVLHSHDLADAIKQVSLESIPNSRPSELASAHLISQVQGRRAYTPNYFPNGQIWLVNPKNLSIYELRNSRVRKVQEEPSRDGVVDWNRWQACNHIEDPQAFFISKNIKYLYK